MYEKLTKCPNFTFNCATITNVFPIFWGDEGGHVPPTTPHPSTTPAMIPVCGHMFLAEGFGPYVVIDDVITQ